MNTNVTDTQLMDENKENISDEQIYTVITFSLLLWKYKLARMCFHWGGAGGRSPESEFYVSLRSPSRYPVDNVIDNIVTLWQTDV